MIMRDMDALAGVAKRDEASMSRALDVLQDIVGSDAVTSSFIFFNIDYILGL